MLLFGERKSLRGSKIVITIFVLAGILLLLACAFFFGSERAAMTHAVENEEDNPAEEVEETGEKAEVAFLTNYITQPVPSVSAANEAYRRPVEVRGIYVTANRVGIADYFDDLVAICKETEVNAMVIDVKTDKGEITFKDQIPIADEMGISVNFIPDIGAIMETLRENDIYPIARIVAFKDNEAYKTRPDLYIKNLDGSVWRDSSTLKSAWMNPYNRESWDYILEIAIGACQIGFKEIQFDYIRFDTSSRLTSADFGDTEGKSRIEIINEFAAYAMEKLRPYGAYVSADVYGTIIGSSVDATIVGQDYTALAGMLDYICPMVYPSHYAKGSMGIDNPDLYPYEVIHNAMILSAKKLDEMPEELEPAIVRPWLQGFTASWVNPHLKYTSDQIRRQIQAAYDAGVNEWIIWNAASNYTKEAFLSEE